MTRTLRIADQLYVGGYVDGRQGAVLLLGNEITHLTAAQCRQLAAVLQDAAKGETGRSAQLNYDRKGGAS